MNDAERHRIFERILEEGGEYIEFIAQNNSAAGYDQDLRQEIFMALWKGLHTYKGKSSLSTWVYRVAMNKAITFNQRNRRPETLMAAVPEDLAGAGGNGTNRDQGKILEEFTQSLGPVDRQVFMMHIDDQNYRQISEQALTTMTEPNLRKRIQRLKQQFTARYLGA